METTTTIKNRKPARFINKTEFVYIVFGMVILCLWVWLFVIGMFTNSIYYRVALNFNFWDWTDVIGAIFSFTISNVALLAFMAGLLGGTCSLIIATEGFTLTKEELKEKKIDYILYENPFISAFRGVFVFLAVLSIQYFSSFSDIGATDNTKVEDNRKHDTQNQGIYLKLLENIHDSASLKKIKEIWDSQVKQTASVNTDSTINEITSLRTKLKNTPEEKTGLRNKIEQQIKEKERNIVVTYDWDIPGISTTSYLKFAILVSLLSFICGYDPSKFYSLISKIPLVSKKDITDAGR